MDFIIRHDIGCRFASGSEMLNFLSRYRTKRRVSLNKSMAEGDRYSKISASPSQIAVQRDECRFRDEEERQVDNSQRVVLFSTAYSVAAAWLPE